MMTEDLSQRVKEFVATELSIKPARIRETTELLRDLGVDGDDADDFFVAFAKEFDVDLSRLELSRHFGPEGTWGLLIPLVWLVNLIRIGRFERSLEPVRISDLVVAAQSRRWVSI